MNSEIGNEWIRGLKKKKKKGILSSLVIVDVCVNVTIGIILFYE